MRWLLDDGPFGILAECFSARWSWPAGTLHVVEEVAAGARRDRSGRRERLLAMSDGRLPCIEVHRLRADSEAAIVLFVHLRPKGASATRGIGEDASIAWSIAEAPDSVFVSLDKAATFVALAELGPGRVATPFDVWDWLRTEELVAKEEFDRLCQITLKKDQGLPGIPRRFAER